MKSLLTNAFWTLLLLSSCSPQIPRILFEAETHPAAPDYSKPENWCALPDKSDAADRTPDPSLKNNQAAAEVDVFFLHPTTYTGDRRGADHWNGPVDLQWLNDKTDSSATLNQSSIFNGAGRVFAPRYRQAHLNSYFTSDTASARKALDLAYSDVKAAFEYYLQHCNNGRPFIIASHSQGTTHAKRLIQELIDDKPLQKQLVAAYLVGIPVPVHFFKQIKVCESPEETGCFCSWRTFKKGYVPDWVKMEPPMAVTNPLNWTTSDTLAPKALNKGAVLLKFNKIWPYNTDAQIHDNILWASKPRFRGSFFFTNKNYHVGDFNLFYVNVRENAILRTQQFLMKNGK